MACKRLLHEIIDLTHFISPDMPFYPGTEQPVFITGCSIEDDGFLEKGNRVRPERLKVAFGGHP